MGYFAARKGRALDRVMWKGRACGQPQFCPMFGNMVFWFQYSLFSDRSRWWHSCRSQGIYPGNHFLGRYDMAPFNGPGDAGWTNLSCPTKSSGPSLQLYLMVMLNRQGLWHAYRYFVPCLLPWHCMVNACVSFVPPCCAIKMMGLDHVFVFPFCFGGGCLGIGAKKSHLGFFALRVWCWVASLSERAIFFGCPMI